MSTLDEAPETPSISRRHPLAPLHLRPARSATVDSIEYHPSIFGGDVGIFLEVEEAQRCLSNASPGHSKPPPSHAYTFDIEEDATSGGKKIHFAFPHNRFRTFELRRAQRFASFVGIMEQAIESWIDILTCSEGVLKYAVGNSTFTNTGFKMAVHSEYRL